VTQVWWPTRIASRWRHYTTVRLRPSTVQRLPVLAGDGERHRGGSTPAPGSTSPASCRGSCLSATHVSACGWQASLIGKSSRDSQAQRCPRSTVAARLAVGRRFAGCASAHAWGLGGGRPPSKEIADAHDARALNGLVADVQRHARQCLREQARTPRASRALATEARRAGRREGRIPTSCAPTRQTRFSAKGLPNAPSSDVPPPFALLQRVLHPSG
jgi:hypothetical protein